MFGSATQFLPLVLIFVVFYFLLIRPQQQKQKEMRSMLAALKRGDRVVTGGGIIGTVQRVPMVRQGRQAGRVQRDRGGDRAQHPRDRAARDHHQRGEAGGGERQQAGQGEGATRRVIASRIAAKQSRSAARHTWTGNASLRWR